jgi:hypothetical protein
MDFVPIFLLFLPTLIAIAKRHPRLGKVVLLNVLLAPTIFGWFYVLYLALTGGLRRTRRVVPRRSPRNGWKINEAEGNLWSDITKLPWGTFID